MDVVKNLPLEELPTSGFVLDTLQAAVWCFVNTATFEEALVTAVNLGGDTDTIGAVAGALAGAFYGREGIPPRWLEPLREKEDILALAKAIYELAQT